ncbi:CDI toxin immunity protein [Enterobacter chuandaensis]|uniref:Uncharacterized protein n=1 Tax=Enterobacter chuandaensis TaxID=2497875 RepID=A0AA96M3D1_9ENTR|nr:hypothetical protein [Enterobacter chuandaensis]MCW4784076.1 hypothetical protein [Enterobacter chuandaensis]MDA4759945.1 hypothetical protein [Enterobacter chuandaensis]OQD48012.1 hypothetical protein BWZ29_18595 [Enterobacter cancerogenus]WNS38065.1 hypothetical protein RQP59_00350 [Enterobacter chuandaensis]
MTLFDECKEALSADFNVLEGQCEKDVIDILHEFPFLKGNLMWENINYSDYDDINALVSDENRNDDVFVFVDDINVPIFRTKLFLLAENVYDVMALSPKLFIFNKKMILQPLFPTEIIRLGIKN